MGRATYAVHICTTAVLQTDEAVLNPITFLIRKTCRQTLHFSCVWMFVPFYYLTYGDSENCWM